LLLIRLHIQPSFLRILQPSLRDSRISPILDTGVKTPA